MRYSSLWRFAIVLFAIFTLTATYSCKSRQYVGPVNGKILKSDDLMKDNDRKADNTPIEQVAPLSDGR